MGTAAALVRTPSFRNKIGYVQSRYNIFFPTPDSTHKEIPGKRAKFELISVPSACCVVPVPLLKHCK
ncbi:hypothetical protein NDU88_007170 [Pleurodeles waltl]|uniref:Uncharacterized protein n=1 Tax=Pleurodeles waltl TaxID=8319 RepID=A0AAV7N1I1_PLEWA|nr:hypothetical protein NDU88_007170 [Pleurodeles waltl]